MKKDQKVKENALWPSLATEESARRAAQQGVWSAGIVAAITTLFAVLSMTGYTLLGINAWALHRCSTLRTYSLGNI